MKSIILFVFIIGVYLITIEYIKSKKENKNPKEKIIYKYIPKTLEDEYADSNDITNIFETMFSQQSPWIYSVNNIDRRKQESINKYFITQT